MRSSRGVPRELPPASWSRIAAKKAGVPRKTDPGSAAAGSVGVRLKRRLGGARVPSGPSGAGSGGGGTAGLCRGGTLPPQRTQTRSGVLSSSGRSSGSSLSSEEHHS
jgi:hypothetical protein